MKTKSQQRTQIALSVAFAFACVALTLLAFGSFGGTLPLKPKGYRVVLPLPDAGNLAQGSDVRIAGVKVGSVVGVGRDENRATATIELDGRFAPIHSGATAIVRTKSLLGEAYVEIAPGPSSAPAVRDEGTLPRSQVRRNVSLDQFLTAFEPATRRRIREVFQGLADATRGRSPQLNNSLGRIAPFSGDLRAVLETLDQDRGDLARLFSSSGTVLGVLGERQGDLQGAIVAGNEVFDVTAQRDHEIAALVQALQPFLGALEKTSETISAASGDLNRAVNALVPVGRRVDPVLHAIDEHLPEFRGLFRDLPGTITSGEQGSPSLRNILHAVPVGFDQLYPTSRQLIPTVELLKTYRRDAVISPLATAGAATNGRMVGVGGRIVARPGAALYASNETIGGWVKRLPTNRANPYPKPGGFRELGRRGYLLSYDCRHLGNRLYVPPTGTGVPPCVTQGPWTYKGTKAYYPRLKVAPP